MSKFNTPGHRTQPAVVRATSVMQTMPQAAPDTRTFEGAAGWSKDKRTDLFLRATSSFHGNESSFYESGETRDNKIISLMREIAVEDFAWTAQFLAWLRGPGNIRTASLMLAIEAVDARLKAGRHGDDGKPETWDKHSNRSLIASVLQRPDEPGEMLAYWTAAHGRSIPKPIKRGIADAVQRMYSEKSLLKYDTASRSYRFADVLELTHASPAPDKPWQGELFQYAIDRRHNRADDIPEALGVLRENARLRSEGSTQDWLNPETLQRAGMTWEDALSAVGSKVDKGKLWSALIPSMGYMALIRNLRNFDERGISDEAAAQVIKRLVDPEEVKRSRQLPFRFLSAYSEVQSLRWGHALETALDLALPNVPQLPGRTAVLTDTSGSMMAAVSAKSKVQALAAAALFATAVVRRNQGRAELYQYATNVRRIDVPKGGSTLRVTRSIVQEANAVGYGTNIAESIRSVYNNHDRVIVLTDAQGCGYGRTTAGWVGRSVPAHVPVYLFNIESHTPSPMPTGDAARFDLGGLSDATFALIPRLEAGMHGGWPWEIVQ